jgi:SAM-dependent methyltransferase
MSGVHMTVDPQNLQSILAEHLPVFAVKTPRYQATMLDSLLEVWLDPHQRLLDIGGGTGVIAQAISQLFPVVSVEAIDIVDRFCSTLTVPARQYDGKRIPCADGAFDAATLNNVLHHVPPAARGSLLREVRRAVAGPLYIKDHLTTGLTDDLRLMVLDAWGNIPFGGMVEAKYLSSTEWNELAAETGYYIGAVSHPMNYRTGIAALAFPNRLETTMRFDPA